MIIYNVTIKISNEIEVDWISWMKHEHIKQVLETGMFDSASFFELVEPADEEGKTFVVQYVTDSESRYQRYIAEFAPALREEGFRKFGESFIAFRSLIRSVE
jgi:hypothetical protein